MRVVNSRGRAGFVKSLIIWKSVAMTRLRCRDLSQTGATGGRGSLIRIGYSSVLLFVVCRVILAVVSNFRTNDNGDVIIFSFCGFVSHETTHPYSCQNTASQAASSTDSSSTSGVFPRGGADASEIGAGSNFADDFPIEAKEQKERDKESRGVCEDDLVGPDVGVGVSEGRVPRRRVGEVVAIEAAPDATFVANVSFRLKLELVESRNLDGE